MICKSILFLTLIGLALSADKVNAALYYEVYCGGCQQMITGELNDLHNKEDMMAITDLVLVPYGNAHVITRDPPTFKCQHGEEECYGNMIELCAIEHNPAKWWDFVLCEEKAANFGDSAVKKCAEEAGIDGEAVLTCAKGTEGPLLHLKAADATPTHKWVPWVIVNEKVMGEGDTVLDMICDAYQGEKPASCKKTNTPEKVQVNVYHEVLCGGCVNLITGLISRVHALEGFLDIADINIVTYGNARTLTRDPPTFECQHGEEECHGNMLELCAIQHNPTTYWDFLIAAEKDGSWKDATVKEIADANKLNGQEILECANGTEGPLLHLKAGDDTPADHTYVPWVTVNGEHLDYKIVEQQLIPTVCKDWTGEKPDFCN